MPNDPTVEPPQPSRIADRTSGLEHVAYDWSCMSRRVPVGQEAL